MTDGKVTIRGEEYGLASTKLAHGSVVSVLLLTSNGWKAAMGDRIGSEQRRPHSEDLARLPSEMASAAKKVKERMQFIRYLKMDQSCLPMRQIIRYFNGFARTCLWNLTFLCHLPKSESV